MLTIPVYYTQKFKTKNDKTFLVSLNWFRNAHHFEQNKVKAYFHGLIKEQLENTDLKISDQYKVKYKYYYKNSTSDLANVTPMCSKWLNDVLQEMGIVQNDNVKYLIEETHQVAGQDKLNPRCEIEILPTSKSD